MLGLGTTLLSDRSIWKRRCTWSTIRGICRTSAEK